MQITKYEHACLDVRDGTSRLVIDPGVYSGSFTDLAGIDAVAITHAHADHFDPDKIAAIIAQNPDVHVFATEEVAQQLNHPGVTVPNREEPIAVGNLTLTFYGTEHAMIDPSYPAAQNMGVLVNNVLYYPGDSFTMCPENYQILAVPIHAPWLKFSETADFVRKSSAGKLFPAHNGFINDDGHALYTRLLTNVCTETNKELITLKPTESIEL